MARDTSDLNRRFRPADPTPAAGKVAPDTSPDASPDAPVRYLVTEPSTFTLYDLSQHELDAAVAAGTFSDNALVLPLSPRAYAAHQSAVTRLATKVADIRAGLLAELWIEGDTPEQTAERVDRHLLRLHRARQEQWATELKALRRYDAACRTAHGLHRAPPPHPIHAKAAWDRWVDEQDRLAPWRETNRGIFG
jgi:hypothetical protein